MMAKRTAPFKEYPEWTDARFYSFLRSALRTASTRWPPKYIVLNNAKRKSQSDNKRLKWEFQCALCNEWFPQKQISIDHIVPCGTLKSFDDLPEFCRRLFVGTSKMQALCKPCHDNKTKDDLNGMG